MYTDKTFILADNQDITRAGLSRYLSITFGTVPTVEVANKAELVVTLMKRGMAVVVLDYTLFDFRSIDDLLVVQRRFPDVVWILFSSELSENFIRRLSLEKNISMILKENSSDEICSALRCAVRNERFLCHQVTNLLVTERKAGAQSILTATETEILRQVARGKSVKEIASERNSSIHTVITHKKNIFRKLGINNVYEATKYALRAGLVEMVEYYI